MIHFSCDFCVLSPVGAGCSLMIQICGQSLELSDIAHYLGYLVSYLAVSSQHTTQCGQQHNISLAVIISYHHVQANKMRERMSCYVCFGVCGL